MEAGCVWRLHAELPKPTIAVLKVVASDFWRNGPEEVFYLQMSRPGQTADGWPGGKTNQVGVNNPPGRSTVVAERSASVIM